jgi:Fe-S-cluster containining protein
MSVAEMSRFLRRSGYLIRYLHELVRVSLFSRRGIRSRAGRVLLLGKLRRVAICLVPGLGEALRRRHNLSGGCVRCGTSCNLLIRCPHWIESTGLCGIYEDRPDVCRLFPITPADMRDLALARSDSHCGYSFGRPDS